jgi:hypothetical protein
MANTSAKRKPRRPTLYRSPTFDYSLDFAEPRGRENRLPPLTDTDLKYTIELGAEEGSLTF